MNRVNKNKRIKFYKSNAWKKKRKEIKARDNNECQHCKIKGFCVVGQTTKLDVHHKKFLEFNWDLRLKDNNLITLCVECHNKEHPEKLKNKKNKNTHEARFE